MVAAPPSTAAVPSRYPITDIFVSAVTYASATEFVLAAAREGRSAVIAATSVHGLTMGALDPSFGQVLNQLDVLTPDGQPVRWALNWLHGTDLTERVYGPTLMLRVCEAAAGEQLAVYFYGSRSAVLERLEERLGRMAPNLTIAGLRSPPFRPSTKEEDDEDVRRIVESGARIVFVGLGCPRQERWAAEHRERLPMPIVCVGAAFDFHAGTLRQAPVWMQEHGLEWLFRLAMEPRRLWRRYTKHIPVYVALVTRQYVTMRWRQRTGGKSRT